MKHLLILILALITINISAQTGYLVVITDSVNHTTTFKTENYVKVQEAYLKCFDVKIDIDKKLEKSNFFEDRTELCTFYCEYKRITYTLRGKKKYKRIK